MFLGLPLIISLLSYLVGIGLILSLIGFGSQGILLTLPLVLCTISFDGRALVHNGTVMATLSADTEGIQKSPAIGRNYPVESN